MNKELLSSREKDLLYEALELACSMVNSLQTDVEEDPNAASNETIIILNKFCDKMDELNEALDGAVQGGLQ
jgi:hypothetical protein